MKTNVSLANYTRFGTGGEAEYFFRPESVGELSAFLHANAIRPITVLGLGSNILIKDSGIGGLVIHTGLLNRVEMSGNIVTAECGVAMPLLANIATRKNIGGFEFMVGIPGTVGGGLHTNAGCFGGQISDILTSVRGVDFSGAEVILAKDECGLGYRQSGLPTDFIAAELEFEGIGAADVERMKEIAAKKAEAQPADARTAGSTFKNPPGGSAWRIIKEHFPNGLRIGGARISEKHANFVIAGDGCTSADIEALCLAIQEKTELELEVEIKG